MILGCLQRRLAISSHRDVTERLLQYHTPICAAHALDGHAHKTSSGALFSCGSFPLADTE